MSNPIPIFVYDPEEPNNKEIQEWSLDEIIEHLNQSSELYFSLNKELVEESMRLDQD